MFKHCEFTYSPNHTFP